MPPVNELPAKARGFITFGCLNQLAKVSGPALTLWSQIVRALPGARLVLQAHPGRHRDEIARLLQGGGISPERVEFVAKAPRSTYLKRYHDLDLCLDPFPYNGHTSTFDALWMGVPTISLAGRTGVGRAGVSLLSNVGLTELVAESPEDYMAIALRWANDKVALTRLRAGLRQRMQSSPLVDGKGYAEGVEAALRRMWETWCQGEMEDADLVGQL
jgi:predicted O-linked N-acetylglucosamine transferase (SPINDLY family)